MSELRHALILAAGLGTRLQPLTSVRAKPAIPVAGDPLVRRIVRWLVASGVTELVINLHHLPSTLTAVVGDGSDLGAHVCYSWEHPLVLGSAGGPRHALPLIGADTFLIVNGDTLTDIDVPALVAAHAASRALVTLALIPNPAPDRYGGVRLDPQGCVTGFVGRGPQADGSFHFVGIQVAQAEAFRSLPDGQAISSIGGAYDQLIDARQGSIRGCVTAAAFWDVGTVADYVRTSRAFTLQSYPFSRQPKIDPSARIARSIFWDDVEVGAGAIVEDCILTDGVTVPAGASYRQMIVRRGADSTVVTSPLAVERE